MTLNYLFKTVRWFDATIAAAAESVAAAHPAGEQILRRIHIDCEFSFCPIGVFPCSFHRSAIFLNGADEGDGVVIGQHG